ncbi:MAG: threonine synthase [Armatimonadota bacterium]|nr:threonine synthase [Armatimonadota bacterium]MCX7776635.1 threonine synthase [Armatimonadota bacterium]MDW8025222.1 threonine synthase [Armatimonadota bacterium]
MRGEDDMRQIIAINGAWNGIVHRYRQFLPITDSTPIVTLCEGNTPLIRAHAIEKLLGHSLQVYLKYEGTNPTGSFKDRGMTVAVSKALERGHKAGICASTGNTSASAAAYCARANIKCIIIVPEGRVALGKLSQALAHGALLCSIKGGFDEALNIVRQICDSENVALLNSLNPERLEGQKTAAFEICDVLSGAPDFHIMPVGNAGNITSHWMGYKEYFRHGFISNLPIMIGVQAAGAAPLVLGHPVENPETIATAIRIGNPARWKEAIEARDESGGTIVAVTDDEIIAAYQLLAQKEGLFVEPAGAASIAGLLRLYTEGYFEQALSKRSSRNGDGKPVAVCVLTGHGLKDPQVAMRLARLPESLPPDRDAVMSFIKLNLREQIS